ncbi:hypothetical protein [Campylobacter cuniculorum]|uniref:Uncharacterized protein n=2 Tax=Campylobacter cuniculorum TaxID=374106 RepID=A0A1W6BYE3_9BACT|nr:hypothetical protein [Campylobacter cuniculorum]ARJ57105.1 hypothetical protein CCUN_1522 [Campylobacter cuniculorum DSM 23162 = LMG 24588]QOR04550.1 hypothetical protein A0071_00955 [Campylobacter cuniculorum]
MSGVIGLHNLFVECEYALEMRLNEEHKKQIRELLYTLSQKNKFYVEDSNLPENIKNFLINYLNANIKDMI